MSQDLGKKLAAIRALLEIDQSALARALSVTRQTIGNWECGKSFPDYNDIGKLIALGVSGGFLHGETPDVLRAGFTRGQVRANIIGGEE
jgi:transcriptional regulator with XRE-family HTH domain